MKIPQYEEIGHYKILNVMKENPSGSLFRAKNIENEETVFIKIYYPTLTWEEDLLQKFFQILDQFKYIEHENLLPILDFGKENEKPFVVFQDLGGRLLEDVISKKMTEDQISNVMRHISRVLEFLNHLEIVHGYLNPENVLILDNGSIKVFEFGFSEIFRSVLRNNMLDSFMILSYSDPKYTAPEQFLGKVPNQYSDMYLFGLIYFEALNLRAPVNDENPPEIAQAYLSQQIHWPKKLPKHISHNTRKFIQKCLQVNSENRFKDLKTLNLVLEKISTQKNYYFIVPQKIMKGVPDYQSKRIWIYPLSIFIIFIAALLTQLIKYDAFQQLQSIPIKTQIVYRVTQTMTPNQLKKINDLEPPQPNLTSTNENQISSMEIQVTPTIKTLKPVLEGTPLLITPVPLSVDNVNSIIELVRFGYGKIEEIDLSKDNIYAAVATSGGVYIFKNSLLFRWIDPGGWSTSVQFSPDTNLLAIGLNNGEIQIWDWRNEEQKSILSQHSEKINRLIFSSNGRNLYSASEDQYVIIWNLSSNQPTWNIAAHSAGVRDIAVSSDGRILATCSSDQLLRIWDLATRTKLREINVPGRLDAVAISQDGEYVAAGGEKGLVRQWSLKTYQIRTDPIPVKKKIWSLEYILDDKFLFVGIDGGDVRFYNADQLKYQGISLDFEITPIPNMLLEVFGPDFEFSSNAASYGDQSNFIGVNWSGIIKSKSSTINYSVYDSLNRLAFSDDSQYLAANGQFEMTNIWNLTNNKVVTKSKYEMPSGDTFSPDNQIVLIDEKILPITRFRLEPKTVRFYQLFNMNGFTKTRTLSEILQNGTLSFAKNGTVLSSSTQNQSKSWDVGTGHDIYQEAHVYLGCWITNSANDGSILQINSIAGVLKEWDARSENICLLSSYSTKNTFAFSENRNLVVTITNKNLIEGIDPTNNHVIWQFNAGFSPLDLTISSDGDLVILTNDTGLVLVVDGKTGDQISTFRGSFDRIQDVKFSPDKRYLAVAGFDGTVRVFGVFP